MSNFAKIDQKLSKLPQCWRKRRGGCYAKCWRFCVLNSRCIKITRRVLIRKFRTSAGSDMPGSATQPGSSSSQVFTAVSRSSCCVRSSSPCVLRLSMTSRVSDWKIQIEGGEWLSNQPAYLFSIKFAKCLSSFLERLLKLLQCCCNFDEKQSVSETLKKSGNVTEHLRNCTKNCKCHVWSGAKKCANLVDLKNCCKTSLQLQESASI